ncbi:MAG: GDSL-type esterase/lipase family protein [Vallitalea sp.]|jgi:hypothetical protein|nr:GDSL-type esterase/lipase family protein [Vallitalea sp.]
MIENLSLHGFDKIIKKEDGSYFLQRVPDDVKDTFSDRGKKMAMMPAGNEIRFVPVDDKVTITLSSEKDANSRYTIAQVYYGDFQDGIVIHRIEDKPYELKISIPDRVKKYNEANGSFHYDPKVVRIVLKHGNVSIVDVKGKVRKPTKDELPPITMLSYGTSITQGVGTSIPTISFTKLAARRKGYDHINLGFGGSAHCEKSIADYIANRNDWDILTLCISVNMLNQGFSLETFVERAKYMVETIASKHPDKKIVCISPIRHYGDILVDLNKENRLSSGKEYRDALRDIVNNMGSDKISYINGLDLLEDFGGLTTDLLHPGDYGAIEMAIKLSEKL